MNKKKIIFLILDIFMKLKNEFRVNVIIVTYVEQCPYKFFMLLVISFIVIM